MEVEFFHLEILFYRECASRDQKRRQMKRRRSAMSDSLLLVADTGNTFHRISKRNFKIMELSFMFEKLNYLAGSFSKMNRAL